LGIPCAQTPALQGQSGQQSPRLMPRIILEPVFFRRAVLVRWVLNWGRFFYLQGDRGGPIGRSSSRVLSLNRLESLMLAGQKKNHASQVLLVGSWHIQTSNHMPITSRTRTHLSPGCLALSARSFLMVDSSCLLGNCLPHRGQRCGSCTPARVDLRGGPPDRLEPGCGSNSSAPSINS
jgi:hypothetical protein